MSDERATNPVEAADTSKDTGAEVQEVENDGLEQELDDDGNPVEAEPVDEEIDLDGVTLKVPKTEAQKVKDALLRQADYTRKTQELADSRKAFEAERGTYQQTSNAEIQALAQVRSIDASLAQYANIDWQAWNDQAADAAARGNSQEQSRVSAAWMEFQQLKDDRANAANQFVGIRQQRALASQQDIAKRVEQTRASLAKDISGYSDETERTLIDFGVALGFTREEADDVRIDPRIAKFLHELRDLREIVGKQQRAANIAKGQGAEPAKVLRGASGATPVRADTKDFSAFERMAARAKT